VALAPDAAHALDPATVRALAGAVPQLDSPEDLPDSGAQEGALRVGKVLVLPARGRVVLCTDLHGNLGDFEQVVAAFEEARAEAEGEAYLLFTGDLIHGPCYGERIWPEHLGTFYRDRTVELLEAFVRVASAHPGRVFSLIGNHEHSHIGGPHTRKFHKDPSETEFLERWLGPTRTRAAQELFRSFPIVALLGRSVVATHGAPRPLLASFEEIATIEYAGHEERSIREMIQVPVLGELFWCRNSGTLAVRRFLQRMDVGGRSPRLVVYGHDPVRKGYLREGDEQLCLSTSFGLKDEKKVYLDLDLEREYRSVRSLRYGGHILPLYPERAQRRLKPSGVTAPAQDSL